MRITDERAHVWADRNPTPQDTIEQRDANPLVDALRAERAAHAATREKLRRAREALRDALSWCETLAGECISAGLDDDDEIKRMIGYVREKRDSISSASPSTHAPGPGDSARIDGRLVGAAATAPVRWTYEVTGVPSTEAAVRAGIDAAADYVHDQEMRGLARQIRECVDPAAIAARLEGR